MSDTIERPAAERAGRDQRRSDPRTPRGRGRHIEHEFDLFWGLLSYRRDGFGQEKLGVFWGLLSLTLRRPDPEPDPNSSPGDRAAYRAEQRVEALRSACILGCLGLAFSYLSVTSDEQFWQGLWGLAAVVVLALAGGAVLSTFADRFRRRFFEDELAESYAQPSPLEIQSGAQAIAMQELAASIAHEIRNPITAAKSLVQQMGEDPRSEENVEYAEVVLEELDRVERSVTHLLRFARDEEVRLHELRLGDVVREALGLLQERADRLGVPVAHERETEATMRGDPEKLRRVVLNLVSNALDALEQHRVESPRVEVQHGANLAGTEIWLRVRDNGPGISPEEQDRIFRPFHTSKEEGTGLGLAITKKLVEAHSGRIEVSSEPGRGAEFLVIFPSTPEGPRSTP